MRVAELPPTPTSSTAQMSGVNGSGDLLDVEFQALTAGSSSVQIFNLTALDSFGLGLTETTTGSTVTVSAGSSAPEPGTGLVLASAVVGLFAFLKLRPSQSASSPTGRCSCANFNPAKGDDVRVPKGAWLAIGAKIERRIACSVFSLPYPHQALTPLGEFAFCEALESFAPEAPMERPLAPLIAEDHWRLNCIRAIEASPAQVSCKVQRKTG